jgi:hypothetical protein
MSEDDLEILSDEDVMGMLKGHRELEVQLGLLRIMMRACKIALPKLSSLGMFDVDGEAENPGSRYVGWYASLSPPDEPPDEADWWK